MFRLVTFTVLIWLAVPLRAEVTHVSEHEFTVSHTISIEADPWVVYRTMTAHISEWWSAEHTWSGDAKNLYMKMERSGCFCERLPNDGRVEHLRIIYLAPGEEIRFDGALGPLQTMAMQGRMIWKINPTETGSQVTFTYKVFGHPEGGSDGLAQAVDSVISQQLERLGERLGRG